MSFFFDYKYIQNVTAKCSILDSFLQLRELNSLNKLQITKYDFNITFQSPARPPRAVEVSSSGQAASIQPSLMGVYRLQDEECNNSPTWKHDQCDRYLYRREDGDWLISDEVGSGRCWIQSRSYYYPLPTASYARWWYTDGKEWKWDDDTFTIQPLFEGME